MQLMVHIIHITLKFNSLMEAIKQQLLNIIATYNQGRPVSYPAIDRKMMLYHSDLVKAGKLGAILDEMMVENSIEQVGPSSYKATAISS